METEWIAAATDNEPLINRAFAAYYRGRRADVLDQPNNSSYLCEYDGKQYVVLTGGRGPGPLAVYRVRSDGILKGLKRWPEEIETV